MYRRFAVGLAASLWLIAASDVAADAADCDSLDLEFQPSEADASFDCYRSVESEASGGDGVGDLSSVVEVMFVDLDTHFIRIMSGAAGANVYFSEDDVESLMGQLGELDDLSDWQEIESHKGYEIQSFAADFDGAPAKCYGFVRYRGATMSNRGYRLGAASFVGGYDCWFDGTVPDRNIVVETINAIYTQN